MNDYLRSTRECALSELPPDLLNAIRSHVAQYHLGDIDHDTLICCETTSKNRKVTGILSRVMSGDPDPVRTTAIVLTPQWFIGARTGSRSGIFAFSARISDIEVREFEEPEPTGDRGIVISGKMTDIPQPMESWWGLGAGPASERLKQVLARSLAR
jgi:hypothetical protein